MRMYHTSPDEIKKVHEKGRFGPGLFFATKPYQMGEGERIIYGLESNEDEIMDAGDLENLEPEEYKKIQHIIKDIMNSIGVDEEQALSLLSESDSLNDLFNRLEDFVNYHDEEDDDESIRKKMTHKHLSKQDIGELDWDMQGNALRASNILGKKGVKLRDEQGESYLMNLMGEENKLKRLEGEEAFRRFENYEEDEEDETSPYNLKFKH